MDPFTQEGFEKLVLALPAVTLHDQWDARVAKVGGKVFALSGGEGNTRYIVFKVPEETFEVLTALEGIGQAAYFARRQWVAAHRGCPLSADELAAYLARSHGAIVAKLTRKARQELGLT